MTERYKIITFVPDVDTAERAVALGKGAHWPGVDKEGNSVATATQVSAVLRNLDHLRGHAQPLAGETDLVWFDPDGKEWIDPDERVTAPPPPDAVIQGLLPASRAIVPTATPMASTSPRSADPGPIPPAPTDCADSPAVDENTFRGNARLDATVDTPRARELQALAVRIAREEGVSPLLVCATIQAESQWSQAARGTAGEVGLGQIHPSVAPPESVATPEDNIRMMCRVLRRLHDTAPTSSLPEPRRTNTVICTYGVGHRGFWHGRAGAPRRCPGFFGEWSQRRIAAIRHLMGVYASRVSELDGRPHTRDEALR